MVLTTFAKYIRLVSATLSAPGGRPNRMIVNIKTKQDTPIPIMLCSNASVKSKSWQEITGPKPLSSSGVQDCCIVDIFSRRELEFWILILVLSRLALSAAYNSSLHWKEL